MHYLYVYNRIYAREFFHLQLCFIRTNILPKIAFRTLANIQASMRPCYFRTKWLTGLPWWLSGKEFACHCRRLRLDPRTGKIPWRRKGQPTPVLLPGKFHGQRSLAGLQRPWGCKEPDTTLQLNNKKCLRTNRFSSLGHRLLICNVPPREQTALQAFDSSTVPLQTPGSNLLLAVVFVQCSVISDPVTLCDPMDCSTPGFPVLHRTPKSAQTHVQWAGDAIQPSHPLSPPPSSPAFSLSQHQGFLQWVASSHQGATVLELQHQSL